MNTLSIRTASSLESKMLAGIVADNVIVEARRKVVEKGETDGEEKAMGREFTWIQEINDTEVENFYRINVSVFDKRTEQLLIERIAFRSGINDPL